MRMRFLPRDDRIDASVLRISIDRKSDLYPIRVCIRVRADETAASNIDSTERLSLSRGLIF